MENDLRDAAEYRGSTVPVSRFEEIVRTNAPDAPRRKDIPEPTPNKALLSYPIELNPLIQSGVAVYKDDHWFVNRCTVCGQFKTACCGSVDLQSAVDDFDRKLTGYGRQAVGLDPIKPPKPPKPPKTVEEIIEDWKTQAWWYDFRGVGELQGNGSVKMYVKNFLPEGITVISGLPKEGKSWLALAVAKALTSGTPLFGRPGFEVPESVPVLYLAAESGDGALKLRCQKFGITDDKTRFITRTLSQGSMFGLKDQKIENIVRAMRPVVILETLIRFNDGEDEDSSSENKKLADNLFQLIGWGAKAVIGIHHSRKDLNKANPTKESAIRGSSDGLAMVDCVWLVMQDEKKFHKTGLIEIDLMGWGRDFTPAPMRLALTKQAPNPLPSEMTLFSPGIVSCIDTTGDLEWVERKIVFESGSTDKTVELLVTGDPSIPIKKLVEQTKLSEWNVRQTLKRLGYSRAKGGKKGGGDWVKIPSEPIEKAIETD